ncbi:cation-translocating P-type ATPase, partial [bacterium]
MKTLEQHDQHAHHHKAEGAPTQAPSSPSPAPTEQAELPLLGMHCSACAVRIEKALNRAPGVENANVNFATTRATVSFDPAQTDVHQLRATVQKAGYDAIVVEAPQERTDEGVGALAPGQSLQDAENAARGREYHDQKMRFGVALALTIPVA